MGREAQFGHAGGTAPWDADVQAARRLVLAARRVVALTGAGVSTGAGIPDFRGPNGVWTKDPAAERLSTLEAYLSDPEVRRRAWQGRLTSPVWTAAPTLGHRAFVDLERTGRLELLVTQNIDGLHQLAGSDPERVVEIHGTMREVVCMSCGRREPAGPTLARVAAGEEDPDCRGCGGILKSATISFGQSLVAADLARAETAARRADLLLAAGTSLGVYPAAGLVPLAAAHGARVVIVNAEPTPFDHVADAVVRGSTTAVLPAVLGAHQVVGEPPWDDGPPAPASSSGTGCRPMERAGTPATGREAGTGGTAGDRGTSGRGRAADGPA